MNGITGIAHAAYDVSDMESALDFYVNKLGFTRAFTMTRADGTPGTEYLRVAPGQFLELFYGGRGEKGGSYNHLCLRVESCEQTVRALMEKGVTIDVMPKRGHDGNLQAWIRDPDGNKLELMQLFPGSPQMKADEAAEPFEK